MQKHLYSSYSPTESSLLGNRRGLNTPGKRVSEKKNLFVFVYVKKITCVCLYFGACFLARGSAKRDTWLFLMIVLCVLWLCVYLLCMRTHEYAYACICVHIFVPTYMHIQELVRVRLVGCDVSYMCMCVCIYVCIFMHTQSYTCPHKGACISSIDMYKKLFIHLYTPCIRAHNGICMRAHTKAKACAIQRASTLHRHTGIPAEIRTICM
jgi:hypothetical protein